MARTILDAVAGVLLPIPTACLLLR